ncbi:MAG: hypothetical protein J3K34DRAFT_152662 [Monoraphidium minutum]|nr:MAG: hypothetical protein J3K34DRAFT_152662 [Monoraphidium minutum]
MPHTAGACPGTIATTCDTPSLSGALCGPWRPARPRSGRSGPNCQFVISSSNGPLPASPTALPAHQGVSCNTYRRCKDARPALRPCARAAARRAGAARDGADARLRTALHPPSLAPLRSRPCTAAAARSGAHARPCAAPPPPRLAPCAHAAAPLPLRVRA